MTLPASGPISFNDINVELGVAGTTQASLGQASYRTLAGVPSGAISMSNFYGKSNRAVLNYTYSSNAGNASLNVSSIGGYISGKSDITVVVNPGVYVYSTTTGGPALYIYGATSGDTITLVNQGYIMGQGGDGGSPGGNGGPALSIGFPMTINNTYSDAWIGGGGGGGGSAVCTFDSSTEGGGGGAGGGNGAVSPGGGGGLGGAGSNGTGRSGGGGGGRVFPGTGGSGGYTPQDPNTYAFSPGFGGTAGGGGGSYGFKSTATGGSGGSANNGGGGGYYNQIAAAGGGGGGWGASGGSGSGDAASYGGGSGGYAVLLNGNSVTWVSGDTSRVYGAVG